MGQKVQEGIEGRERSLQDILSSLELLSSLSFPPNSEGFIERCSNIDHQHKMARNLGEDVLDDSLKLDSLENLTTEDRDARRIALSRLEALAAKLDSAKDRLSKLRGEFEQEHG